MCLVAVLLLMPLVAADYPVPPRQSAFQASLFSEVNAKAKIASDGATAELLSVLDSADFRSLISACCSDLSKLPAEEILARYRAEIETIEMVHNFHGEGGGFIPDSSLGNLLNAKYFYNQWQLEFLGIVNNSRGAGGVTDIAEVGLFGFQAFSNPQTFDEVSDRPTYTAFSLLKADDGNPHFGTVSMIFSPNYVRNLTVIAPIDTGLWEMSCNSSRTTNAPPHHFAALNCSGWDRSLGTLDHYDHMVLSNVRTWVNTSSTGGVATSPDGLLALEFGRVFAPETTQVSASQTMTYWEANIAGNVLFPDGIKYVIGNFAELWGTNWSTELRQWCINHGWILVWALGSNSADTYQGYDRLVDAMVVTSTTASRNVTVSASTLATFNSSWTTANTTRNGGYVDPATLATWWSDLYGAAPGALRVHSLKAYQCSDINSCIGFSADGKCVCY